MEIDILTEDMIPEITKHGNDRLRQEVADELADAQARGYVIYVRYEPYFLQRIWFRQSYLDKHPGLDELIRRDEWWTTV
jgi:hypothetical protein